MKIRSKTITLIPVAALLLAACQHPSQQPVAEPTASTSSALSTAPVASTTVNVLTVTPSSMATCDPAAVAKIHWATHASEVQIFVGTGSNAKLFAAGGATGDAETGPWVRPGTRFVAINKSNGKVLARVAIQGPKCIN